MSLHSQLRSVYSPLASSMICDVFYEPDAEMVEMFDECIEGLKRLREEKTYCLYERKKTYNINSVFTTSTTTYQKHRVINSKCASCGRKKSRIIQNITKS
jgi:hypothetical protein